MTADLLRRAAAKAREGAVGLPAGPWEAYELALRAPEGDEWIVDSETRLIAGNIGISTDPLARPLAEHIATWSPPVALGMAILLESVANRIEARPLFAQTPVGADALAVARAILNEPEAP